MAQDVQYISFENGAPDLRLPSDYTDDQVRDYLKSEKFQKQMYGNGYGYVYGLTPVNLLDKDNLNDNSIQAGAKSAVDTLKQIGAGALAFGYDVFGNEEKQAEAIQMVKQYQLDQMAHKWRETADGQVRQRVESLEQVFESEQEFGAFLEWLGNSFGQGAVTSIPFFLAGALTGGVGAVAMGGAARATAGGFVKSMGKSLIPSMVNPTSAAGKLGAALLPISPSGIGLTLAGYTFGAGDTYVNQLEETDDPNAAIAAAAGVPYALAENMFGAGAMLLRTMIGKSSQQAVKDSLGNMAKLNKGMPIEIEKTIKMGGQAGSRAKTFAKGVATVQAGEALAEGLQESITQTGQTLEGGRSLTDLYSSVDFWKQVGEGAAAGFAGGTPFGAVGGTIQAMKIGPSMTVKLKGGGQMIDLPKIDGSVASDPGLWETLDFQPADIVTYTGAPVVTDSVDGTESEQYDQPNANNNASRTYFVAGTAEFQGKKHIALVSTDNKTEMFVPVESANNILNFNNDATTEKNSPSNNNFIFDKETSSNVNLNRKGIQKALEDNLEVLRRRGYKPGLKDLKIDKASKKQWVQDQVDSVQFKTKQYKELKEKHTKWLEDKKPDIRKEQSEFYNIATGAPLEDFTEVIDQEFGYKIPGQFKQYLPYFDNEVGLREQLNGPGWEQEQLERSINNAQDYQSNKITTTQRTDLNELGYETPEGERFIKRLLNDDYYLGGRGSKSNGRNVIDKIIKEKVTFGDKTFQEYFEGVKRTKESVKNEVPLNQVPSTNTIGPATIQEFRTSLLGEGLYNLSVKERLHAILILVNELDTVKSARYQEKVEKTLINTLRLSISKYRRAGALDKALKAEAELIAVLDKTYIIGTNSGVVGSLSENARFAVETKLNKLLDKKANSNAEKILIDNYRAHLKNINVKRTNLNNLLNSFNIESITTNEGWNKFNGVKTLKQLREIDNRYTVSTQESAVGLSWMDAKQGTGQPRLSEDFARNSVAVLQALQENIDKLDLDIRVELTEFLEQDNMPLAAAYIPGSRAVKIALNGIPQMLRRKNGIAELTGQVAEDITDIDRVNFLLYHEVMHVLSREGFFKQHEIAALKKAAKEQWIDRYKIRERYPNDKATQALIKQEGITYEDLLAEEAMSEAFADYMTGRFMMKGPIARAFLKLRQYLVALGNALTGKRFNKPESIFNQIDLGIVGRREKSLQRSNVLYDGGVNGAKIIVTNRDSSGSSPLEGYNLIPYKRSFFFGSKQDATTNTEAFFKWFNKGGRESVVTTPNGAPLVVMHTTKTNKDGIPFTEFDMERSNDFGMHFTATQGHLDYIQQRMPENIGQRYHTFKGYLQLSNPLRMNDLVNWDPAEVVNELIRLDIITRAQGDTIIRKNPARETDIGDFIRTDYRDFYNRIVKVLSDKGYDGIVYENYGEDAIAQRAAMRPKGEVPFTSTGRLDLLEEQNHTLTDSYIIFNNKQFKEVSNVGGYNGGDPNMFASREWQESEGGMPDDQYVPLNRQQGRDLNRRAMTARQGIDKSVEEKANLGGKGLSWINRWFGAMREWAATNLQFAKLYSVAHAMQDKSKSLLAKFTNDLALYNQLIDSDPAIALLLRKAQIISQHYQNQGQGMKFFKNANGQIILSAPMSMAAGAKDVDVKPGETIILEGDVADAFLRYDKVMDEAVAEIRKGLIAGTYEEELIEAIKLINKIKEADSNIVGPQEPWSQTNLSTTELEELTGADVELIVNELRRQSELMSMIGPATRGVLSLENKELTRVRALIGFLPNGDINAESAKGLGRLMQELKKYDKMREGTYVPLMRYGKYFISVTNPNIEDGKGQTVEYQMFESKREAEAALPILQNKYFDNPNAQVSAVGEHTINELKRSIQKKAIGLVEISQYLSDPAARKFSELEKEVNRLISENKDIVGFDSFLTPRAQVGGVAGYSADFGRSAQQFLFAATRTAARNRFMPEARQKYNDTIEYAKQQNDKRLEKGTEMFWDYTNDPKQEFAELRQIGFWFYLGGNMSSALLQIMSNIQFTGPILAEVTPGMFGQKGTRAAARLLKAQKEAISMLSFTGNQYGDTFIDWDKVPEDVKTQVEEDMASYLKQGQAMHEAGQVPGTENMGSKQKRAFRQFENMIIGGMFNTMEATSRLTAYIAAMRTFNDPANGNEAIERMRTLYGSNQLFQEAINRNNGDLTPQIATRFLIDETFGVYGKLNRPAIMRKWGSVPALFQTYISQMIALMYRMLTKGDTPAQRAAGRRVFLRMMGMMVLTGGYMGIPGSDDAEDLASWMVENVPGVGSGLKTDFRSMIREMLYDTGLGAKKVSALENGLIETYLNIDVQRRLSLGNFPYSQQVRALAGMMGLTQGGKAADFAGAPGSVFLTPIKEGFTAMREGRGIVDVAFMSSPLFIRNGWKAYKQAMGKGFVETNYGTVIRDDVTIMETALQAMGFGSAKTKRAREAEYMSRFYETRTMKKQKAMNAQVTNAFRDIIMANKNGDKDKSMKAQLEVNELTRELYKWNSSVDPMDMITIDVSRLWQQAILASNQALRSMKLSPQTQKRMNKFREMYDF